MPQTCNQLYRHLKSSMSCFQSGSLAGKILYPFILQIPPILTCTSVPHGWTPDMRLEHTHYNHTTHCTLLLCPSSNPPGRDCEKKPPPTPPLSGVVAWSSKSSSTNVSEQRGHCTSSWGNAEHWGYAQRSADTNGQRPFWYDITHTHTNPSLAQTLLLAGHHDHCPFLRVGQSDTCRITASPQGKFARA